MTAGDGPKPCQCEHDRSSHYVELTSDGGRRVASCLCRGCECRLFRQPPPDDDD